MISVSFNGLTETESALDRLRAGGWAKKESNAISALVRNELKRYPPPRGYPRTGRLSRGWGSSVSGTGLALTFNFYNSVPYADLVQGFGQAKQHQGYWHTVEMVMTDQFSRVAHLYLSAAVKDFGQ
jgi:hypothetical protein